MMKKKICPGLPGPPGHQKYQMTSKPKKLKKSIKIEKIGKNQIFLKNPKICNKIIPFSKILQKIPIFWDFIANFRFSAFFWRQYFLVRHNFFKGRFQVLKIIWVCQNCLKLISNIHTIHLKQKSGNQPNSPFSEILLNKVCWGLARPPPGPPCKWKNGGPPRVNTKLVCFIHIKHIIYSFNALKTCILG